jgi:hypothetical protein
MCRSWAVMPSVASVMRIAASALSSARGAKQRELLDTLVDMPASPDSGRVDQPYSSALALDDRVDRVARRAGYFAHHGPLLAGKTIQETGLPDIRAAHDGDARVGSVRLFFRRRRELRDDRIEKVARADALERRDGVQLPEPELIELRRLRLGPPRLGLVRRHHDRLAASAQAVRDVVLDRKDPRLRVDHEHHDVGLVDRRLGLPADAGFDLARAVVEAAGVHQCELTAAPFHRRIHTIAGRAGLVLHDGHALADEPVEER